MNETKTPVTTGRNLELHLAMLGKGGNLTHGDRRTKRVRDRGAGKRAALRDQA